MKNIILLVAFIISSASYSQYYKTYDWKTDPTIHSVSNAESQESSIGILERKIIEFKQSETTKQIAVFETSHKIFHVNDETGISRHNQVYIPMYNVKKLQGIKARTISKDGTITT